MSDDWPEGRDEEPRPGPPLPSAQEPPPAAGAAPPEDVPEAERPAGSPERRGERRRSDEEPPEFDPATILFHGSGLLVVDKPAGIPIHRGTSHPFGLAEMIDEWVRRNPGVLDIRSGRSVLPIHRLDLEATGVVLFGLRTAIARELQKAFGEKSIRKKYLAVVAGPLEALGQLRGEVRSKLRGRYRRTREELTFRRLRGDDRLSLAEVVPEGGRTHQIRELFAEAGRPLAGDLRYGRPTPSRQFLHRFGVPYFLLHALELTLPDSILGAERTFRAPVPDSFRRVIAEKAWEPLADA